MFGDCRKGWIGIDWAAQALKLAQVERGRGELGIAASAIVERHSDARGTGESTAAVPPWSADDLRTALTSDPRFSGRRAACVLPMHLTDLRPVSVPPGTAVERYAMVRNEIASGAGDDGEETEFDFWDSDGGDASPGAGNVNTLSVSRRVVNEVTRTLSQAGLDCEVLDGLPLAMNRAVGLMYGPCYAAPVAVLDWGFASSTFCVVCNGGLLFTRHLRNCGLVKLFETTRQTLNLSDEDVMEVLARYGLPGGDRQDGNAGEIQAAIAETAGPHLHEIGEELWRTIAYAGTQHSGIVLERLCLLGDGASVRHGDYFLSRKLGLPVDRWGLPAATATPFGLAEGWSARLGGAVALSALAWSGSGECAT
jgi:Tfp pilus assembly PilM family ATPase